MRNPLKGVPFLTKILHRTLGLGDNHVPYNWSYANSSARVSATGFKSSDLRKLALQQSDNSLWMLTSVSPGWAQIGGGAAGTSRELLTTDRTYYVATTGSDSNTGLTALDPFLTLQKAINIVAGLDLGIYNATISVADGTYTAGVSLLAPFVGTGTVTLQGNTVTPANCIISTGASNSIVMAYGANLTIKGFKLTNSGSFLLHATNKGVILFSEMDFGACGSQQIRATDYGIINAAGNYTISGAAAVHMSAVGALIRIQARTVTITGTPAFSTAFAQGTVDGLMIVDGNTYTGSATGIRYSLASNAVTSTAGGGANYLPGNSAGSTATGAQYI